MTITLTGTITCKDGQFKATKSVLVLDDYRPNVDDRFEISPALSVKVSGVTFAETNGRFMPSRASVYFDALRKTRAEVESLFVENGFSVSEVEK